MLAVRRSPFVARPYLWGPAVLVAAGVLVPLGYLFVRAFEAEPAALAALVLRGRNLRLLGNTLGLTAGVLAAATALALPLAWLVTRTDLRGARVLTLLGVLPLAVPGYVLAKTQNWLELGLFYGPTPFGPWTTLFYGPFVPAGAAAESRIFTAQVVINWSYRGVLSVMWSGAPRPTACADPQSGNYDAVHLTRFAIERI